MAVPQKGTAIKHNFIMVGFLSLYLIVHSSTHNI